jgi:hypothetical protein
VVHLVTAKGRKVSCSGSKVPTGNPPKAVTKETHVAHSNEKDWHVHDPSLRGLG